MGRQDPPRLCEINALTGLTPFEFGSGGCWKRQWLITGKLPANRRGCVPGNQGPVYREIVLGHALGGESPLKGPPDFSARECVYLCHRLNRAIHVIDNETRNTVLDNLRDGPPAKSNDRRPAGHRLDHDQTKRLRPVYREQQTDGVAQEITLGRFVDLADELDIRVLSQQRADYLVPIRLIRLVYLGRNLEPHPAAGGNFNGSVRALLR